MGFLELLAYDWYSYPEFTPPIDEWLGVEWLEIDGEVQRDVLKFDGEKFYKKDTTLYLDNDIFYANVRWKLWDSMGV